MMHNRFILFYFIILISGKCAYSQSFTLKNITGKWKVMDWKSSLDASFPFESKEDKKLAIKHTKECLKNALIIIDTNGFIFKNKDACGYEDCNSKFVKKPPFRKIPIFWDSIYTITAIGEEIMNSNRVGGQFMSLFPKNCIKRFHNQNYYSQDTLVIVDTYCKESWGSSTIKICILNKDVIGLFSGADLLILKRVEN